MKFNKLGSSFQIAGAAWQKARLSAVLGAVLHRIRWVDGRNCLVGWLTRINDDRYPGRCMVNTLRVSSATLYNIRALIGSQCRAARTGVMLSNFKRTWLALLSSYYILYGATRYHQTRLFLLLLLLLTCMTHCNLNITRSGISIDRSLHVHFSEISHFAYVKTCRCCVTFLHNKLQHHYNMVLL